VVDGEVLVGTPHHHWTSAYSTAMRQPRGASRRRRRDVVYYASVAALVVFIGGVFAMYGALDVHAGEGAVEGRNAVAAAGGGRGLHSPTSQLNLSRF